MCVSMPKKIKVLNVVPTETEPFWWKVTGVMPPQSGTVLECEVNQFGAVLAILPDGSKFGLKAEEFEYVEN